MTIMTTTVMKTRVKKIMNIMKLNDAVSVLHFLINLLGRELAPISSLASEPSKIQKMCDSAPQTLIQDIHMVRRST